jgi:hypothetical protein
VPGAFGRRTCVSIAFALMCVRCTSSDRQQTDVTPAISKVPPAQSVEIKAAPVPLNPTDPTQTSVGAFTYAGGVELAAVDSTRLHGLSDLRVAPDGRVTAITDEADVLQARLALDAAGRLVGLSDSTFTRLLDLRGNPLQDKGDADSEGLALFPNGDRLVSFERDHRIWLYPAGSYRPTRVAPKPEVAFPANQGMEALTTYPSAGPEAFLVGSEGGRLWLCRLSSPCQEAPVKELPGDGFGLSGAASFGETAVALLYRAYDQSRGVRTSLRLFEQPMIAGGRMLDELTLTAPLTRDNFEGVAVVAQPAGMVRFYLISDDNFSRSQHTYLLAFDWMPVTR